MKSKPDLLLLPGMLCDEAFWSAQVAALSDVCRPEVISYASCDSIEAMARLVLRSAPDTFALVGHSMGGRVAQEIYRLVPYRVTKLALFATDYRGPLNEIELQAETLRRDELLASVQAEGMKNFARGWARQVVSTSRWNDLNLLRAIEAMTLRHTVTQLAAQTLAGLTRPDFSDLLPRVGCSTLICAGEDDSLRSVQLQREMAALVRNHRLKILKHCGHMIAVERPQMLTRFMRTWLLS
jgi:pimeloyl-ACP methyl ester carboxylesterase